MPTLTFMVGCPASGKSTVAKEIAKKTGAQIVSTDGIRAELFGDENCQDDPRHVFEVAHKRIAGLLAVEGKDVVFDATNLHRKDRELAVSRITYLAKSLGAFPVFNRNIKLKAVLVRTDLETCLERNAKRDRHVPEDRIRKMWQASGAVTEKTLKEEGFEVEIVNNSRENSYDLDAYNDGFRDAESTYGDFIVNPKYKGVVMAALREAYEHELLGSIGDKDACDLYHRLKYEDYCKEHGKSYDELTEDDFEEIALKEAEERERDYDD